MNDLGCKVGATAELSSDIPTETTSLKVARGHSKHNSIKAQILLTIGLKFGGRSFCLLGMSAGGGLFLCEDCSDKKKLANNAFALDGMLNSGGGARLV